MADEDTATSPASDEGPTEPDVVRDAVEPMDSGSPAGDGLIASAAHEGDVTSGATSHGDVPASPALPDDEPTPQERDSEPHYLAPVASDAHPVQAEAPAAEPLRSLHPAYQNPRTSSEWPTAATVGRPRNDDPLGPLAALIGKSEPKQAADPFAELAALLGQSDAYPEFGEEASSNSSPRLVKPVATATSQAPYDWRTLAASMPPYEAQGYETQGDETQAYETQGFETQRSPLEFEQPPRRPSGEPLFGGAHEAEIPQPMSLGEEPIGLEFLRRGNRTAAAEPQPQQAQLQRARAGGVRLRKSVDLHSPELREDEPYFSEGPRLTAGEEQSYDDVPRAAMRMGGLSAAILVACAIVGTATAYGYRTYYKEGGTRPTSVMSGDLTAGDKVASNDSSMTNGRLSDVSPSERTTTRPEQPAPNLRVVLPPPVTPLTSSAPTTPTATPEPHPGPANTAGPAVTSEPKRVRTTTFRANPNETASRGSPAERDTDVGQAHANSGTKPASPSARGNRSPMSLDPQAPAYAAAPAEAQTLRERSAAVMPLTPPAPRETAPARTSAGSGHYLVQLSSQRSEAEAHASYRAMQAKYASQLAGHEHVVKRADLGSKGTFYRSMVGPFASAGEAEHFCAKLKSAGAQCITQRN